jgi:hypothetical protein
LQPYQFWRVRRQGGCNPIRIGRHRALEEDLAQIVVTQIAVVDSDTSNPANRSITVILLSAQASLPDIEPDDRISNDRLGRW